MLPSVLELSPLFALAQCSMISFSPTLKRLEKLSSHFSWFLLRLLMLKSRGKFGDSPINFCWLLLYYICSFIKRGSYLFQSCAPSFGLRYEVSFLPNWSTLQRHFNRHEQRHCKSHWQSQWQSKNKALKQFTAENVPHNVILVYISIITLRMWRFTPFCPVVQWNGLQQWHTNAQRMLLNLDMLGLFSVEFMACHVTAGWAPSVHIVHCWQCQKSRNHYWMFPCS